MHMLHFAEHLGTNVRVNSNCGKSLQLLVCYHGVTYAKLIDTLNRADSEKNLLYI